MTSNCNTYWNYSIWDKAHTNIIKQKNIIKTFSKYTFCFLFVLFYNKIIASSGDTIITPSTNQTKIHSPKKAALMSALLPGLGQAYNKKYWKIPIVYAGMGGLAYVVKFNNDNYQRYRRAYVYRVDGDPTTIDDYENQYTDGNLNTLQEYYHRTRDLAFIGVTVFYILNIIDATVDAHLFTFDVSDNLSMHIQPTIFPANGFNSPSTGFALHINLSQGRTKKIASYY